MRLVTFNMERGGGLRHWSRVLAATGADLLFAQETVDPSAFQGEGWEPLDTASAVWSLVPGRRGARRARWGSALLVRSGTLEPIAVPGFEGWVVGGKVHWGGTDFHAFSVHIPARRGTTYEKLAGLLVTRLLRIVKDAPVVLGGDWNVTVGRRHPEEAKKNSRRELAWLDRLEKRLGVVPAWQACHRDRHLPQTLRWRRDPLPPYHCDGIFLPVEWASRLRSAEVLAGPEWSALSDHNPVVVEVAAIDSIEPASPTRST